MGDLIRGEGNPNLMLRVFVQGGGCSGLQYGFEFDEQLQDGDTCVENLGVKLLVDPMSVQYLSGRRDRLPRGPRRGAVRDPQSERGHDLRLRFLVHGRLTRPWSALRPSRPDPPQATSTAAPLPVPDVLAAVDLGSNSFHMVVARYSHGQLVIIDRLREMVRLAAGVEENGRIDKEVAERALGLPGALRSAPARHARR